jgi:hypothetical protein
MAFFTTALGLYGGVLWSGELQGVIKRERVPSEALLVAANGISDQQFACTAPSRAASIAPGERCEGVAKKRSEQRTTAYTAAVVHGVPSARCGCPTPSNTD